MSALMKYCTAREDYGFEYNGGGEIVIEKYAKLPCKAKRYISTIEDNQTELDLRVHSWENGGCSYDLILEGIPPLPRGSAVVEVCICVDSSNQCYASMEELTSGVKCSITFQADNNSSFNMGEMENIPENIERPPEIIGAKKHCEVKVELLEKVKLLKELRENKGEGAIQSEYLDEIIQRVENKVDHQCTIQDDKEIKEMIKEVEKSTALFYETKFKLENDLGVDFEGRKHLMIHKKSKIPCKVVLGENTDSREFKFFQGKAYQDYFGWSFQGNSKSLGKINVGRIPPLGEYSDDDSEDAEEEESEYIDICLEICTSGVLYASVEHLRTRKMFYKILNKGRKCTKREVEGKIHRLLETNDS